MNKIVKSISVVLATLLVASLAACGTSSATNQSATEFQNTVSQAGVIVLDVRTPGEFAEGHIANAININVEGAQFASQIEILDKSAAYAVYCHSGRRSGIAIDKMASAGFVNLYNLDRGISAWTAAGLPVTQ